MKTVVLKDCNFIFSASNNRIAIHIYENETRKGIIRSPFIIKDFSIITNEEVCWILCCLTSEGQLFKVSRSQVCDTQQSQSSDDLSDQPIKMQPSDSGNIVLMIKPEDSVEVIGTESRMEFLQILHAVSERNISRSLSEGDDDIFSDLLATDADKCELSLSTEPFYQLTSDNEIYSFDKENVLSLCMCQTCVFSVSHCTEGYRIQQFSCDFTSANTVLLLQKQYLVNLSISKTIEFLPKLFYVSCDFIQKEDVLSSDHIKLSDALFTCLFGNEAALLKSPLILFCSPFGSVFYASVKTLNDVNFKSRNHVLTLFCQTSSAVIGIEYVRFSTKWDEVVDEEIDNKQADGLFIATNDGKCILISARNSSGAQFSPIIIPAPVKSLSIHTNTVYHSSGRDLFQGEITAVVDTKGDIVTANIENQTSLGIQNIQSLLSVQNHTLTEGAPCNIFYKNSKGQHCHINPEDLKKLDRPSKTSNSRQLIKDVLLSLEKCHTEQERLENIQKAQSSFINQLSIASFLICGEKKDDFFKHDFTVKLISSSMEFELNYEITNQSKVLLSHDWKLLLSVRHVDSSRTKSVMFTLSNGLKPMDCIAISTVFPDQDIYLPFEVQVQLQLEIPSHLEIEVDGTSSKILPVILTSQTIDIIYFIGDEKHQKKFINQPCKETSQIVEKLAISRPISKCLLTPDEIKDKSGEPVTLMVYESLQIINSKDIRNFGKDEAAVLKYLFRNNKNVTEISSKSVSVSVCGGSKVYIDVSMEGQIIITIQSTDLPLCTAVRMAVLARLQGLKKEEDTIINLSKLQASLKNYDELLKDLQNLEEERLTSDPSEIRDRAIMIYRKLRQSQPFIQ